MTPPVDPETLLVALKECSVGAAGMDWAIRRACESGLPLLLVHVVPTPGGDDPEDALRPIDFAAPQARMEALVDQVRDEHPTLHVRGQVLHGSPARVLVALSGAATTLVLGNDPGTDSDIGPIVRGCLDAARCPVLVVPMTAQSSELVSEDEHMTPVTWVDEFELELLGF